MTKKNPKKTEKSFKNEQPIKQKKTLKPGKKTSYIKNHILLFILLISGFIIIGLGIYNYLFSSYKIGLWQRVSQLKTYLDEFQVDLINPDNTQILTKIFNNFENNQNYIIIIDKNRRILYSSNTIFQSTKDFLLPEADQNIDKKIQQQNYKNNSYYYYCIQLNHSKHYLLYLEPTKYFFDIFNPFFIPYIIFVLLCIFIFQQLRSFNRKKEKERINIFGNKLNNLASGNFNQSEFDIKSDFLQMVIEKINNVAVNFGKILNQIYNSANNVFQNQQLLEETTITINEYAENEASCVEKTATSFQTLTNTIEHITKNVTQSTEIANNAVHEAKSGGNIIREMIEEINAISISFKRIENINTLINEIADQTSLLSLNASIEAARAGEAGKGFAVVANEIGKLADRTNNALTEINTLIKDNLDRMSKGVARSIEANVALDNIISYINKISHIINDIDFSMKEENRVGNEIMKSIQMINEYSTNMVEQAKCVDGIQNLLKYEISRLMEITKNFSKKAVNKKNVGLKEVINK